MKKILLIVITSAFSLGIAKAQTGDNNQAVASQTGNENSTIVDQLGNDNLASVSQVGNFNLIEGLQDVDLNELTIDQLGNDNVASSFQFGFGNISTIIQGGFGGGGVQSNNAIAFVDQFGVWNDALIAQRQGFSGGTDVSDHAIFQEGSFNFGTLESFNGGNFGTIFQLGFANLGEGFQSSTGHELFIGQEGDFNWALINQLGDLNNLAEISQLGNFNQASTSQVGDTNDLFVTQEGNDNTAGDSLGNILSQNGDLNLSSIVQDGLMNNSMLDILGNSNTTSLIQFGSMHTATQTIIGSSNSIISVQN